MRNVKQTMVIIVDHEGKTVDVLKQVIEESHPDASCLSFRYADEALFAICKELKHLPAYIFLVGSDEHIRINQYMSELRTSKGIHHSKIIVFAEVLPHAVANAFVENGATFAFQKPVSRSDTKSVVEKVFS